MFHCQNKMMERLRQKFQDHTVKKSITYVHKFLNIHIYTYISIYKKNYIIIVCFYYYDVYVL